jgi:hypothetical protein
MATNIYNYEEKVEFDPENPVVYFGWYISTSSSELKVAHFKRRELRVQMIDEVRTLLPESRGLAILAACTLIMSLGGNDLDSDFARDMAMEELGDLGLDDIDKDDKWDALRAIGDKYATNYE